MKSFSSAQSTPKGGSLLLPLRCQLEMYLILSQLLVSLPPKWLCNSVSSVRQGLIKVASILPSEHRASSVTITLPDARSTERSRPWSHTTWGLWESWVISVLFTQLEYEDASSCLQEYWKWNELTTQVRCPEQFLGCTQCSKQMNPLLLLPGHYTVISWMDGRMNGVSWCSVEYCLQYQ